MYVSSNCNSERICLTETATFSDFLFLATLYTYKLVLLLLLSELTSAEIQKTQKDIPLEVVTGEYSALFCTWTCYEMDPSTPASPVKQTYTWWHYLPCPLLFLSISFEPAYLFRVTPSPIGYQKRNRWQKLRTFCGNSPLSALNTRDQNFPRLWVLYISIIE